MNLTPRPQGIDLAEGSALRRDPRDGIWKSGVASAVSYPESGNRDCFSVEERSFWFAHRNEVLVDLLRRYPPEGPVFDIGGGNGFVAAALQGAGWPVVLLEPGAEGAANARARGLENVACSTLEDAGFARESLAAAGLFDVLEHIENDVGFLTLIVERLRPGGLLYLTVPAHPWLWSSEDRVAGHFRRYRRRTLERALRAAGFEVSWMSHFFAWLPVPIWFLRVLPGYLRRQVDGASSRIDRDHRLPNGILGRWLGRRLAGERKALARGRRFIVGASLAAVARSPRPVR